MMNRTIMSLLLCLAFSQLLNGCSITPSTIVQKPDTPRVAMARPDARTEGAIFNSAAFRPLFEDRRPRYVGDIVTVRIAENTTANKASDNEQTKDGSTAASVTGLFVIMCRNLPLTPALPCLSKTKLARMPATPLVAQSRQL